MQVRASGATVEPTVFVVDDDPAMRESLRWLIESVGLRVETFATGSEFLEQYQPGRGGCLVLDVRMPGMSGLELQEKLKARGLTLPVIILTGHADVPMAVRALKAGAIDFVEKPFSDQLLLDRIQHAIEADRAARRMRREIQEIEARMARLTPRERQVMERVVAGKPNREIAEELGLSPKTIEVHRAHVMDKMRAGSLAELVQIVLRYRNAQQTSP